MPTDISPEFVRSQQQRAPYALPRAGDAERSQHEIESSPAPIPFQFASIHASRADPQSLAAVPMLSTADSIAGTCEQELGPVQPEAGLALLDI